MPSASVDRNADLAHDPRADGHSDALSDCRFNPKYNTHVNANAGTGGKHLAPPIADCEPHSRRIRRGYETAPAGLRERLSRFAGEI